LHFLGTSNWDGSGLSTQPEGSCASIGAFPVCNETKRIINPPSRVPPRKKSHARVRENINNAFIGFPKIVDFFQQSRMLANSKIAHHVNF
jgi:hypothetical protein